MKLHEKVVSLLYDGGERFWLLQDLARHAGTDIARLSRALETLRQQGQTLEFSPTHGVRLHRPAMLSAHLVERDLGCQRVGANVICFDEVGSTNDVAFDSARQAGADGLAVLAESQKAGRGRLGRRWVSPRGANLLMSVLLIDGAGAGKLPPQALTVAAGLAVAEAIEESVGLECRLKWPNDVELDGCKVAGVLVEMRTQGRRRAVVVGMGINCNAAPPPTAVDRPAASLAQHLGHSVERIEVARAVLRRLDYWVRCVEQGALDDLRTRWLARCGMLNQRLTVQSRGRKYTGRVLDVSPLEGIALAQDNGQEVYVPSEGATVLA